VSLLRRRSEWMGAHAYWADWERAWRAVPVSRGLGEVCPELDARARRRDFGIGAAGGRRTDVEWLLGGKANMRLRAPRVVDLFCGAGGLSEGFRQAGCEIAAGLDIVPHFVQSFALNNPGAKAICADIREVPTESIARPGEVDVLIGGPCCQGFSTHGKRIAEDSRNFLFREMIRVARDLRPGWVLIENVKGLLYYDKGRFRQRIHEALFELGYAVDSRVLCAADFGVPQRRERVFFIATRTGVPICFPKATHGPGASRTPVTVRDAIGDLPSLGLGGGEASADYPTLPHSPYQAAMRRGSQRLTLHHARPVSQRALSIIQRIPEGHGIRYLPEADLPERFRKMRRISNGNLRRDCTTLYHRLRWEEPAYTVTCFFTNVSAGPFVHPEDDRALTRREAARLQSFLDAYSFTDRDTAKQIGNAVPPLLAKAIAEAMLGAMRGKARSCVIAAVEYPLPITV